MSVILGRLSGAFLLNCELFALTLLFALPLGLVVAFGSMSRCRLLSGAVKTFVWVIRGTPLMLQIIVIYLGPGLLGMNNPWPSGSGGRMVAAVVAFAINLLQHGIQQNTNRQPFHLTTFGDKAIQFLLTESSSRTGQKKQ